MEKSNMIEQKINFPIHQGMHKFASAEDYLSIASKYSGTRLVKLALNEMELRKRIQHYDNPIIRDVAKDATILFNNHVGIVSKVNELNTASQVDPTEFVFFRCRAIDAGGFEKNGNADDLHGANDNGDYFSAEELLKPRVFSTRNNGKELSVPAFNTFVGKLFFTNHKNDDVSQGKGMIINAYYDLEDNCVYTDIMVDAVANPELARAIREGYLKDVSMGCAVEWSECSICKNKASNVNEYCEHIKNYKGRKFGGKQVYEINHDLKFIEISAVTEGAFKNCTIDQILSQDDILNTVSEMKAAYQDYPLKTAHQTIQNCKESLSEILRKDLRQVANAKNNHLVVQASEEHLGKLYQGLDTIREVIMDMIQLENIDYDYVADLTKIMKDLQASIFDLASAGFNENEEGGGGTAVDLHKDIPGQEGSPGVPQPDNVEQLPQRPQPSAPQQPPQTEDLPLAANKEIKKEDLIKISNKLKEVILDCSNVLKLGSVEKDYYDNDTLEVSNSFQYDPRENQMIHVAELFPIKMEYNIKDDVIKTYWKKNLIKSQPLRSINQVAATLIRNSPENALEKRVKQFKDHIRLETKKIINSRGKIMSDKVKTAATDKILYRQLDEDLGGSNSKHVRDTHEVDMTILEGMLDSLDTTPETGPSEYMLEGKVQSGKTSNERINPVHTVDKKIGEGQMADNSRRVNDDEADNAYGTGEAQLEQRAKEFTTHRAQPDRAEIDRPITEGQMDDAGDLGNKRLEYALLSITEEQMKSKREDDKEAGSSGQTKWSFSEGKMEVTSKDVADLVLTALTNAVVKDSISPARVVNACANLDAKSFGDFNANDSIQKFAAPIRSEEDIINRVALRIAEVNHNYDLTSNDKDLSKKWDNVLKNVISVFNQNNDKFLKVLSNKADAHLQKLSSVVHGKEDIKTAEEESKQVLASILDGYLPDERPSQVVSALLAFKDFGVTSLDESGFEKKAVNLLQDIIVQKSGVKISDSDIAIEQVGEESDANDQKIANIQFRITASDEDFEKMESSNSDVDVEASEDNVDDTELTEVEAMSQAIKNVFAQQAPGGFVGGPNYGGAPDQQAPAPADGGAGDAGLGSMSTPPPNDFSPLDEGGGDEMGGGNDEVGTPQMPGVRCPKCGSMDVEEIDKKSHCKTCQSDWTTEVNIKMENNESDVEEVPEEDEFAEGEDMQNELDSSPTAQPAPAAPMANSKPKITKIAGVPTRVTYVDEPIVLACNNLVRTASMGNLKSGQIGTPMAPGHRCPDCASLHVHCEDSAFQCITCGTKGKFRVKQNSEDGRFATVTVAYLSKGKINKPSKDSVIVSKFNDKLALASEIMEKRTADNGIDKSVDESLKDLVAELHEDGYSIRDAETLKDIVVESMLSENLAIENNSEEKIMPTAKDKIIELSDDENKELDDALGSDEEEMEAEAGSETDPTPVSNKLNHVAEEEDEDDGGSEDGSEEIESIEEESDEGDDVGGGIEDVVILDDDEDDFGGGEDGAGDLEGGEPMISMDINTPDDDVHIEVDDGGHVEVDQGYAEDGGMEDESPDFIGDDEGAEIMGDEESALSDIAPDLSEDFVDEDGGMEDETVIVENSDPLGAPQSPRHEPESDPMAMVGLSQEDQEIKMLRSAALMNTKAIPKFSEGFGATQNWDLVCRAIGKDPKQIKAEAKKLHDAEELIRSRQVGFSDPNEFVRGYLLKKAQQTTTNQTQPLEVEDDAKDEKGVSSGIPRKEQVGFKDVDYDPVRSPVGGAGGGVTEVKTDKYQRGKGGETGGETSVVPRAKGDSGISGIPKPEFAEEKANKATSGNPDTYFQPVRDNLKPTPKSSEKNRVRASDVPTLKKIAEKNHISIKDIKAKKIGGMYVACHKNNVWKWGQIGYDLDQDISINFPEVTVKISSDGRMTKKTNVAKESVKTSSSNGQGFAKFAMLKQTASNASEAIRIVKEAQNVPEQFIEYADFDTEFIVRDTRVQDPEKGSFIINKRKANKK